MTAAPTDKRRARSTPVFTGLACAVAANAVGADEALLIGGGHAPWRSEAQIELNVAWVRDVLEAAGVSTRLWFTDGEAAGADVMSLPAADAPPSALEPLQRVFDDPRAAALSYRENRFAAPLGSTRRDELLPALAERIDADDEPLLLVYNGHGSQSPDSPAGVSLNLWDETSLRADELHEMLGQRREPFRWVFTQCYSGGFHRLAFADPDEGLALAEGQRCGFSAESAYRLAEGCSASIDIGDYRDYTTYFFAALSGNERDGSIVDEDPDADGDGVTTLREAHFYTLEHAYSSDLSRSTSEEYLDAWQPWYLRWLPRPVRMPSNEFARVYRDLAARLQIPLDDDTPQRLRADLSQGEAQLNELTDERIALRLEQERLRDAIVRDIAPAYPALLGPYSDGYRALAQGGGLLEAAQRIEAMADYAQLVAVQDADEALDADIVELERANVQRLKLLRLRRLATLEEQLQTHGSAQERRQYDELVSCEASPLSGE